mmetsp:Transcript_32423/g.55083  ORF Transcript_32423/g.55083 Transcript_32423/m.55083 type:complete len:82 (+) Transcript_32423:1781-2026(+)
MYQATHRMYFKNVMLLLVLLLLLVIDGIGSNTSMVSLHQLLQMETRTVDDSFRVDVGRLDLFKGIVDVNKLHLCRGGTIFE